MPEAFDTDPLLRLFSELPEDAQKRLVLIGGQAISFWSSYFLEGRLGDADLAALTSSDLDIVSETQDNVRVLARAWGGEPTFSSFDDHTPNLAVIELDRPGWNPTGTQLTVDVMGDVYGASAKELLDWAEELELTFDNGQVVLLRVVVPEMLLWTRIANLYYRRMGSAATQRELRRTKVLCQVVREHLDNLALETFTDNSLRRVALKHAALVYKWIAVRPETRKVLADYPELISPYLSAVPKSKFWPEMLLDRGLPGWQRWLVNRVDTILQHRERRMRKSPRKKIDLDT